jgi:hypothetical protein
MGDLHHHMGGRKSRPEINKRINYFHKRIVKIINSFMKN